MDLHVKEYFSQFKDDSPKGNFHKVIALHENELTWDAVKTMVPQMGKGWFELARLKPEDRIEFTCDFWLSKLPYQPNLDTFLMSFFNYLDDIGVFISQRTFDDPFEASMVYSLKNDEGFFRGSLPATEDEITKLKSQFSNYILPVDYLAFLQIHNGFCKATDVTGIIPSANMQTVYENFQNLVEKEGSLTTSKGKSVNPKTLTPFYESFGMPFFQCFWAEWYPQQEMGNVYYSGTTKTIIDVESNDPSAESMAFPTFLDWLMFYMERIE